MKLERAGYGVYARFMHRCGHESVPLYYGAESFAASDRSSQEAGECLACTLKMPPERLEVLAQASRRQPGLLDALR